MKISVPKFLLVGFILPIFVLLLIGLFFLLNGYQSIQGYVSLVDTLIAMGKLDGIIFHLSEAEISQQEFIRTGEERYRTSYQTARDCVQVRGKELANVLSSVLPEQRRILDALRQRLNRQLDMYDQGFEILQKQGSAAAVQFLDARGGDRLRRMSLMSLKID